MAQTARQPTQVCDHGVRCGDVMRKPGFRLGAVLVGLFVDIGGTLMAVQVMGVVIGVRLAMAGTPEAAFEEALYAALVTPRWLLTAFVIGTGFTALGGYVAAQMGRHDPVKHALVMGVLAIGSGLLLQLSGGLGESPYPLWYEGLSYAATIPAALIGGRFVRRQVPRLPGRFQSPLGVGPGAR